MNSVHGAGHSNMSDKKKLKLAIEPGKRVEHSFSGRLGADSFPYVDSASNVGMKFSAGDDRSREIPFCTYAPEWAEHARFDRSDDACDDGRAGEA
jgi:hypothetical protein